MTDFDLNGPWTGVALREKPPLPYRIKRKRKFVRIAMLLAAIFAVSAFNVYRWAQ